MTDTAVPKLNLKQVLSGAQLPALPQSAIRLLELSQDASNGPTEFAVPIDQLTNVTYYLEVAVEDATAIGEGYTRLILQ